MITPDDLERHFTLLTAAARAGITLRFPPYAGWFAAAVFAVAAVLTLTWKTKNAVTFRGR